MPDEENETRLQRPFGKSLNDQQHRKRKNASCRSDESAAVASDEASGWVRTGPWWGCGRKERAGAGSRWSCCAAPTACRTAPGLPGGPETAARRRCSRSFLWSPVWNCIMLLLFLKLFVLLLLLACVDSRGSRRKERLFCLNSIRKSLIPSLYCFLLCISFYFHPSSF